MKKLTVYEIEDTFKRWGLTFKQLTNAEKEEKGMVEKYAFVVNGKNNKYTLTGRTLKDVYNLFLKFRADIVGE